jgi:hypothetical protein
VSSGFGAQTVHPEPVEGQNGAQIHPFMVRQAHHERKEKFTTNGQGYCRSEPALNGGIFVCVRFAVMKGRFFFKHSGNQDTDFIEQQQGHGH